MNKKPKKPAVATVSLPVRYEYVLDKPKSQPSSPVSEPLYQRRRSSSLPDLASLDDSNDEKLDEVTKKALDDLNKTYVTNFEDNNLKEQSDQPNEFTSIDIVEIREVKETDDNEKPPTKKQDSPPHWYAIFILWHSGWDLAMTFLLSLIFFVISYMSALAVSYSDRMFNSPFAQRYILPDVVGRSTGRWFLSSQITSRIPFMIMDLFGMISAFLIVLRLLTLGRDSCKIIRRVAVILSFAYILRTACFMLTILPNPNPDCKSFPLQNIALDALVIMINGRQTCGDVFFSGNQIVFTTCLLLWMYKPFLVFIVGHLLSAFIVLFNLFASVCLVVTISQYSIDVIVAAAITTLTWCLYWTITETDELKYGWGFSNIIGRLDDCNWYENAKQWRKEHNVEKFSSTIQ